MSNRTSRRYIDIDLNFVPHPVTGDIAVKYDNEAVKASIKHLVLTNLGERLFQPTVGSTVSGHLFENITPLTVGLVKKAIEDVINRYEPRAELIDVKVEAKNDENSLEVTIMFYIINVPEPVTTRIVLERIR